MIVHISLHLWSIVNATKLYTVLNKVYNLTPYSNVVQSKPKEDISGTGVGSSKQLKMFILHCFITSYLTCYGLNFFCQEFMSTMVDFQYA